MDMGERMKRIVTVMRSISVKVILLIIVLVLPLNVFSIMETNTALEAALEQARLMEQNIADAAMSDLNERRDNMQSLLFYFLQRDPDCIKMRLLEEKDYEYKLARMKLFDRMRTMAGMIDGADGYFYYTKKADDILSYSAAENTDVVKEIEQFVIKQVKEDQKSGWNIYEWNGEQYLLMVGNVKDIAYGGWINLDKNVEKLYGMLHYQECEVQFSTQKPEKDSTDIRVVSGDKDVFLNIGIKRQEILQVMSGYHKMQQRVSWMYLLVIPILYLVLKRILLKPLFGINNAHREMQKGNLAYRIKEKGNSVEYEEAFRSFNSMAEHIGQLKIEMYEKEISRQKMELRNLQLQIRPHFLLNTFNLIFVLTQKQEKSAQEAVRDVVLYLSDYFRYIFRSDRELELFQKEQHMLHGYARMIGIRYQERVKILFDFEPEIMFVRIPPLLILNFVENAVRHGLKKDQNLNIEVSGTYERGMVEFVIYDDGNGMSAGVLKRTQDIFAGRWEPEENNAHVGMYNSLKRIRYFYGDSASISVASEEGVETEFVIRFPYSVEVEDESLDCE